MDFSSSHNLLSLKYKSNISRHSFLHLFCLWFLFFIFSMFEKGKRNLLPGLTVFHPCFLFPLFFPSLTTDSRRLELTFVDFVEFGMTFIVVRIL